MTKRTKYATKRSKYAIRDKHGYIVPVWLFSGETLRKLLDNNQVEIIKIKKKVAIPRLKRKLL